MTNTTDNKQQDKELREIRSFVQVPLGSATQINLDGASEIEGFVTDGAAPKKDEGKMSDTFTPKCPPWGREPSLKARCEDAGIDFDKFIESLKNNQSDQEMAGEFNVKVETIENLREYFETMGLDTVMGQD